GLDRSTLFPLTEDEKTLAITHSWAAPGFDRIQAVVPKDEVPWALGKILRGETLLFSRVDDLPEKAARDKETLRSTGPNSDVTFPMAAGGCEVRGAMAMGERRRERARPDAVVQR